MSDVTRRRDVHLIEVGSNKLGDLSRARALVGIIESLSPIRRESLCSSIAVPVDLRIEDGKLTAVLVHSAWGQERGSLKASGTAWSGCRDTDIRGQCLIDMLDTYATLLGAKALISGKPPVMRPVVDGVPRMLIGDTRWLISGEPWSGSMQLPLGTSRRDTVSVLVGTLEQHAEALSPQLREILNRHIREDRKSKQPPEKFLVRLARDLRHARSDDAKTAAFKSALRSRSARALETEVGEDRDFAAQVLGEDVLRAVRDQRELERALESEDGFKRRSREREVRVIPRVASQWFDLDLRPPGEGAVETPEPLDLDRRFVVGDMDWIVRRLARGELDLANTRIATTARVALEESLAATEAPRVAIKKGRWNSLERMWAYTLEASVEDDRLATHILIRAEIDGRSDEYVEPLDWGSTRGVRSATIAQRLPPGRDIKVSASLVWKRDGLLVAGQNVEPAYTTTPRKPSELVSALNNVRGGDETDESPEMKELVARSRRRAFRNTLVSIASISGVVLAYLFWTEITGLPDFFWSLLTTPETQT